RSGAGRWSSLSSHRPGTPPAGWYPSSCGRTSTLSPRTARPANTRRRPANRTRSASPSARRSRSARSSPASGPRARASTMTSGPAPGSTRSSPARFAIETTSPVSTQRPSSGVAGTGGAGGARAQPANSSRHDAAIRVEAAAVLLHAARRGAQPEAGAQPGRPDHRPERLEDPLHVLRRDPWPAVLDRDAEALRRELDRNPDHAVLRRKLHGVGQQVREDLLDALRIRVRVRQAVRRAHLEVQVLLPRRGTERIGGFTDQPRRRFGARLDAQRLAGLEARDVQQVLDQPVHL